VSVLRLQKLFFKLGRGKIAKGFESPLMIEPPHPFERCELHIAVGGRAPPVRKTPRPCAESHSPAAARDSPVPTLSIAGDRRSRALGAGRCHVPPAGPNSGASDASSRSFPRSIESPPTASHTLAHGPAPTALPALALLVKTVIVWFVWS